MLPKEKEIQYQLYKHIFSSDKFNCSVVSESLLSHGLKNARPPCPSANPGAIQTHIHWVGNIIEASNPLSSPSPPAFSLSQHQCLFQWVSSSHEVAKYCSFSFNISPPNEYLGLIFFSIDWLDLLEFQETLKRLLQHHSSKASMIQQFYPWVFIQRKWNH